MSDLEDLSIRDYFAAEALGLARALYGGNPAELATEAYRLADAMLGARASGTTPEAAAPAVIERTPAGRLAVLHLGNEAPAETAARLIGLASWELDGRLAEQVRAGVFEPRTVQGVLHLARECFAAIDESLREHIRSGEVDAACSEIARERTRTAVDQLAEEEGM